MGSDSEGAIDDSHEIVFFSSRVERDVELTFQIPVGKTKNNLILFDDVVIASKEVVLVVNVQAGRGDCKDGVLAVGGQVYDDGG